MKFHPGEFIGFLAGLTLLGILLWGQSKPVKAPAVAKSKRALLQGRLWGGPSAARRIVRRKVSPRVRARARVLKRRAMRRVAPRLRMPKGLPKRLYRPSSYAHRRGSAGLLGKLAPALQVARWTSGDRPPPSVPALRGKIVYLYAFQSWCPACRSRGFPVTTRLAKEYRERKDIEFIYIQTTFEGHRANTFNRAVALKKKWGIKRPVGHDSHYKGHRNLPYTMAMYRTGGTPWTVMIDHYGRIRFNDFSRSYDFHKRLLTQLIQEKKQ